MGIIDTVREFMGVQDWRLIIAGFVMLLISLLMIYLVSLIVLSFKKRRAAIDVKLPDLDANLDNSKKVIKVNEVKSFEIQSVESDDKFVGVATSPTDDEHFLKALSIEAKTLILGPSSDIDMPEVGELDYEGIKRKMEIEAEERERLRTERLKEIASSDGQDLLHLDMEILKDGGAAND